MLGTVHNANTSQQWWHGMIAAVIGSSLLSVIVILNSRGAALYHVGFPVYVRASAGVSGSKLFVAVRASVAVIYFATQTYYVRYQILVFYRNASPGAFY